MVREYVPVFIYEGAVSIFQGLSLEGKGNEITKTAGGQVVLHGHHAVVGGKAFHIHRLGAFCQKGVSKFPGFRGRNGRGKENPHVGAVAGAGPFHQGIDVVFTADPGQCAGLFLPGFIICFTFFMVVEIKDEEPAGVVGKEGIEAHYIAGILLFTLQMGHEDGRRQGNVFPVLAVLAADFAVGGFRADAMLPEVIAGREIAEASTFQRGPTTEHVTAAVEIGVEETGHVRGNGPLGGKGRLFCRLFPVGNPVGIQKMAEIIDFFLKACYFFRVVHGMTSPLSENRGMKSMKL